MKKITVFYIALVFVIGGLFYVGYSNAKKPGQYDAFAQCLTEKNVQMYGTYWCPHCAEQKRLFGKSFQYVDYIECGIRGNTAVQTALCQQKNIKSYPTWEINATRKLGVYDLETLSALSGCPLA